MFDNKVTRLDISGQLNNPLSPNSDKNEISLYIISTCSKVQVVRIKKVSTKEMSWYQDKFSLLDPNKFMQNSKENMYFHIRA